MISLVPDYYTVVRDDCYVLIDSSEDDIVYATKFLLSAPVANGNIKGLRFLVVHCSEIIQPNRH